MIKGETPQIWKRRTKMKQLDFKVKVIDGIAWWKIDGYATKGTNLPRQLYLNVPAKPLLYKNKKILAKVAFIRTYFWCIFILIENFMSSNLQLPIHKTIHTNLIL
jgi:hypothetical protein